MCMYVPRARDGEWCFVLQSIDRSISVAEIRSSSSSNAEKREGWDEVDSGLANGEMDQPESSQEQSNGNDTGRGGGLCWVLGSKKKPKTEQKNTCPLGVV